MKERKVEQRDVSRILRQPALLTIGNRSKGKVAAKPWELSLGGVRPSRAQLLAAVRKRETATRSHCLHSWPREIHSLTAVAQLDKIGSLDFLNLPSSLFQSQESIPRQVSLLRSTIFARKADRNGIPESKMYTKCSACPNPCSPDDGVLGRNRHGKSDNLMR